ncbi:MAG: hypothetical protein AAGA85_14290 [Bacteroidota bacterium]
MKRLLGIVLIVVALLIAPQLFLRLDGYKNVLIIVLFLILMAFVGGVLWFIKRQDKK